MLDVIKSTVNAFLNLRTEPWQDLGDVLLVGEGNLSFSKSLICIPGVFEDHKNFVTFIFGKK